MGLRPDRETYATGYRWLDKVTDPYWRVTSWWWERKWWLAHARPGESWEEARDRMRPLYAETLARWRADDRPQDRDEWCDRCQETHSQIDGHRLGGPVDNSTP